MKKALKPFGQWAETMLDNGFRPVPTEGKRPTVNNWPALTRRQVERLANKQPDANVGIALGKVIAIDIDNLDGQKAYNIMQLMKVFLGENSFMRVGKWPKRMFFYYCPTAFPTIRVPSLKLEILGVGALAVVFGIHPGTKQPYYWPNETLLDVDAKDLPLVNSSQLQRFVAAASILDASMPSAPILCGNGGAALPPAKPRGVALSTVERNNSLFAFLLGQASCCANINELANIAKKRNATFSPPLALHEVHATVKSVWKYKVNGNLMIPGKQVITFPMTTAEVTALAKHPEAFALLGLLRATRSDVTFQIPQRGTASALDWGKDRVKAAIKRLVSDGYLIVVSSTMSGNRNKILYTLGNGFSSTLRAGGSGQFH